MRPDQRVFQFHSFMKYVITALLFAAFAIFMQSNPSHAADEETYPDGILTCNSDPDDFNGREFNNLTIDMNGCDWTSTLFPDEPHVFLLLKDIKVRDTLTYVPGNDTRKHYLALSNYAITTLNFECPDTRQCELWLGEHPNPAWEYKYGRLLYLNLTPYGKITLMGAADKWLQHSSDGTSFDPLEELPAEVSTKGPDIINFYLTPGVGSPIDGGTIKLFQAGTKRLNLIPIDGVSDPDSKVQIGIWAYIGAIFSRESFQIDTDDPEGYIPVPEESRLPQVSCIVLDTSEKQLDLKYGGLFVPYLIYFGNPENSNGGLTISQSGDIPVLLHTLASMGGNLYYDNDNLFEGDDSIEEFRSFEYVMSYDDFVASIDEQFEKANQFEESVVEEKILEITKFPPERRESYPEYTYHFDYVHIGSWVSSKNIENRICLTGSCDFDVRESSAYYSEEEGRIDLDKVPEILP